MDKCSILWVRLEKEFNSLTRIQKKVQFFDIFKKKRSIYSLSQIFSKIKIFFESHLTNGFNFFESCWKEGFNFYGSCWKEGSVMLKRKVQFCGSYFFKNSSILWVLFSKEFNSLSHIFKAFNSLSHIFKKLFNSLSHIVKKRSILLVTLSKSVQSFQSYGKKRSILWVIFSKSVQFFESYLQNRF